MLNIKLTFNTEQADKRIKALQKAKTAINDFIKKCENPPSIQGRGISPHIRKLFKE